MRRRRWIAMMAMVGVLLHAAALVRHHGVMLAVHLEYQSLVSGLSAFCHGGLEEAGKTALDLPAVPQPSDAQNGCPICAGHAPALAVIGLDLVEGPAPAAASIAWGEPRTTGPHQFASAWPPARGPPASPASA